VSPCMYSKQRKTVSIGEDEARTGGGEAIKQRIYQLPGTYLHSIGRVCSIYIRRKREGGGGEAIFLYVRVKAED